MRDTISKPSRRALVTTLAAFPVMGAVTLPALATTVGDDAELLALEAEIRRIRALADDIKATRIAPFDREYLALRKRTEWQPWGERAEMLIKFSTETGREAAIREQNDLRQQADGVFERMMAIPAVTQAGRAAKVRTDEVDEYGIETARRLLGEFAGMTEAELAAI